MFKKFLALIIALILSTGVFMAVYAVPAISEPTQWLEGSGYWDLQLPEGWDEQDEKIILVYCHGIVDPVPYAQVSLPNDELAGIPVSSFVLSQGWAYASTSYEDNGMIAATAVENVKVLVEHIKTYLPQKGRALPDYWIIAGPSEGGLVTVLSLERHPELFDGGIAVCGPIGSFYQQLQYNGDFHVLFNYFFGDQGIGDPLNGVSEEAMYGWSQYPYSLQYSIGAALAAQPSKAAELIKTSKATIDISDPAAAGRSLMELLRFNVMFTNDINQLLDGVIFYNKYRFYYGSSNDFLLNRRIQRIASSDYFKARRNLDRLLETTGNINDPLVTIHTTGDHIVPAWHQTLYRAKVWSKGKALYYTGIPVAEYGHCTISAEDLQKAISIVMFKIKAIELLSGY